MPVDDYLESWIFSACTNVVNECEPVANHIATSNPDMTPMYNAAKADLLILARKQLDKIGVKHGHLPDVNPFNMNMDKKSPEQKRFSSSEVISADKEPMTNQKLREAAVSSEAFDKMYMVSVSIIAIRHDMVIYSLSFQALSTRAIKGYDLSNRVRSALWVHGDIASFKLYV